MNIFFQLATTLIAVLICYLGMQDSPLPRNNTRAWRALRLTLWPLLLLGTLTWIWQ